MTVDAEAYAWIESLSRHLTGLDEYRRRVEPMLASQFNVLRYARTDECGLSLILADLLDPRGSHGQGERFLACFLKLYWKDKSTIDGHVSVRTEVATDRIAQSQRRLDIEIDLGDRILAIENKPWAADQPAQIKDYLEHLKRFRRPARLIYLTGRMGQQPSGVSIEEIDRAMHKASGSLAEISYHDLREWIRDCQRCCENERVAMFLRDLDRFVAETFALEREDFVSKLIVDTSCNSAGGIRAAFQWSALATDVRRSLLERLERQILYDFASAVSMPWRAGWELIVCGPLDQKHSAIEVRRRTDSALTVRFEFGGSNCSHLEYGISRRSAADSARHDALNSRLDTQLGQGASSDWWTWSRWFERRHWWNDRSIWAGILDNSLSQSIMKHLDEMLRVIDVENLTGHFEGASIGPLSAPAPAKGYGAPPSVTDICTRPDGKLVDLVIAIESANWQLKRALGRRVSAELKVLVDGDPSFAGWDLIADDDLTGKYHGFVLRTADRPGLELCVEFQMYGCRGAIYGLCIKGTDGRSHVGDAARKALADAGLAAGKNSLGWVWYRPLDPVDWFESAENAVAAYEGRVASRIAENLGGLILAVQHAGLLAPPRASANDDSAAAT